MLGVGRAAQQIRVDIVRVKRTGEEQSAGVDAHAVSILGCAPSQRGCHAGHAVPEPLGRFQRAGAQREVEDGPVRIR